MVDLGLVYRDLGPEVFDLTLIHDEGLGAHRVRAAFYARCALLGHAVYGLRPGQSRYLEEGLAQITRTFRR